MSFYWFLAISIILILFSKSLVNIKISVLKCFSSARYKNKLFYFNIFYYLVVFIVCLFAYFNKQIEPQREHITY